jgi:hypothetical protein
MSPGVALFAVKSAVNFGTPEAAAGSPWRHDRSRTEGPSRPAGLIQTQSAAGTRSVSIAGRSPSDRRRRSGPAPDAELLGK